MINFLIYYCIIGFILSLIPIFLGKICFKDVLNWTLYCIVFYPVYIIVLILVAITRIYDKNINKL